MTLPSLAALRERDTCPKDTTNYFKHDDHEACLKRDIDYFRHIYTKTMEFMRTEFKGYYPRDLDDFKLELFAIHAKFLQMMNILTPQEADVILEGVKDAMESPLIDETDKHAGNELTDDELIIILEQRGVLGYLHNNALQAVAPGHSTNACAATGTRFTNIDPGLPFASMPRAAILTYFGHFFKVNSLKGPAILHFARTLWFIINSKGVIVMFLPAFSMCWGGNFVMGGPGGATGLKLLVDAGLNTLSIRDDPLRWQQLWRVMKSPFFNVDLDEILERQYNETDANTMLGYWKNLSLWAMQHYYITPPAFLALSFLSIVSLQAFDEHYVRADERKEAWLAMNRAPKWRRDRLEGVPRLDRNNEERHKWWTEKLERLSTLYFHRNNRNRYNAMMEAKRKLRLLESDWEYQADNEDVAALSEAIKEYNEFTDKMVDAFPVLTYVSQGGNGYLGYSGCELIDKWSELLNEVTRLQSQIYSLDPNQPDRVVMVRVDSLLSMITARQGMDDPRNNLFGYLARNFDPNIQHANPLGPPSSRITDRNLAYALQALSIIVNLLKGRLNPQIQIERRDIEWERAIRNDWNDFFNVDNDNNQYFTVQMETITDNWLNSDTVIANQGENVN